MSTASTIDFAETDARSSAQQTASNARSPAGVAVTTDGRMEPEVDPLDGDAAASFSVELERRFALVPVEALDDEAEAGVLLLVCGALAAVAGVTFLRRLGIELEAIATVLLVMGLWGVVASARATLDR